MYDGVEGRAFRMKTAFQIVNVLGFCLLIITVVLLIQNNFLAAVRIAVDIGIVFSAKAFSRQIAKRKPVTVPFQERDLFRIGYQIL